MELREIEAFLAVAEELHFGRAASRLYRSQARVSQLVRSLEGRVGARLFERSSRRVALTPLGSSLAAELRTPHEQLRDAVQRARLAATRVGGLLRVGFYSVLIGNLLSSGLQRFQRQHREATVSLIGLPWNDLLGPLRRDEIDVLAAWVPLGAPDLVQGPVICWQDRVLIVAADHVLAGRRAATLEDVADHGAYELVPPFPEPLRSAVLPPATPCGRPIDRQPVTSFTHVLTLLPHSRRVHASVVAAQQLLDRPGLAFVPIPDLPPLAAGLVWRSAAETATILAFAEAVGEPAASP
jgi:DNA-binding transcriptional LysR family regulator